MRIIFVIHSLRMGGAERVLAIIANHLVERGQEVVVLTMEGETRNGFYQMSEDVRCIGLDIAGESDWFGRAVIRNWKALVRLRREYRRFAGDAIVGFMDRTNVLALIASIGFGRPVIVTEHTDPYVYPEGRIWRILRATSYRLANSVVVLNEYAATYFRRKKITNSVVVIPNPIIVSPEKGQVVTGVGRKTIVSVGRLTLEKGFDLLMRAFAHIASAFPEWDVVIVGGGPQRDELQKLAKELGLGDRVYFTGVRKNPHNIVLRANLYVAASRVEGFPCALVEAMALGRPVVACEYNPGIRELIEDGVNGIVVRKEDEKALAKAMEALMREREKRKQLGEAARKRAEQFEKNEVMKQWDVLLRNVVEY